MAFTVSIDKEQGFPIVTLKNTLTGTEAEIYAFGGLLNALKVPMGNKLFNMIDGFGGREDVTLNLINGFRSAKLSPFVCRMHNGDYSFEGTSYHVNKHYLKEHAIHGLIYDLVYDITDSEANSHHASVTMQGRYDGTDIGYPFPYLVKLIWQLEAGNKISVRTKVTNLHTSAIPLADGWHPYFTLGGVVDEWMIQFDGTTQLEYDAALLPSGKKFEDLRFIEGCSLEGVQLDNSFELNFTENQARCVLSNADLSLTIEPDSSYPLLQLYIPDHRKSIAIENLSGAPDNFNNGMWLIHLQPGEEKIFTTSYTVTQK